MYTSNLNNLILNSDSYKTSHWVQYPSGSEYLSSYVEARKGDYDVVFFGLQAFIKEYLSTPITHQDIDEAEMVIQAHGLTFNRAGWEHLVDKHDGYLPLRIEAVAEGSIVPVSNVVCQVINTDPEFYWLPSYIETALLRAIWYPSTVASVSHYCKGIIRKALEKSADNIDSLTFRLHDFGSRGASSQESVALGSLAHLVNFAGTDSMTALVAASRWYQMGDDMPAFSIPAAEHSTMTAWGRDGETAAFANMIEQFGGTDKAFSVVSDSYDLWNAIDNIWGDTLKEDVKNMGGTLVIRPDSGEPTKVVREALERLAVKFGTTINSKGYKVLPDYVRIIQGDGISAQSLSNIIDVIMKAGFSAENVTFGMGGGLLQQVNRDTMSWAMKSSAISIDGAWKDIYKDPVTSRSKRSKKGRLALVKDNSGQLTTVKENEMSDPTDNLLRDVYVDGQLLIEDSLTTIRERAGW
ncbi:MULTISPECIES: nicotinate phosphoribosyltransferase [unclassified Psychrobacter]|uniref:nicotinate phosphoribosyltransferase n=1 Tax=unclassified Psychrobacter TaxID=196806 RepID=UPI00086C0B76|nr:MULTISPECIES: nicotinate phosphoribosyltransferase [unclassified Psychrobacter]OEH67534.1 MAG: nicotinate phosphoribosyltransferase [Psychrobacter sp. B29-1]PKG67325.1 nicotinate phosphoribosyltransferase [Psychrobacter sp. Choline-02u-13]PKH54151.1 nicotinate phosphoribosyltransferase [Psychrobacter sp. Choline-02u-9]|tara:strand:- start:56792 stop:58189 length:1398 start_codon:yes stop_codon:yes gene_type:complete